MNDRCERIRERIEDSIGRALGTDKRAELDRHCAECESCRKYREMLLDDHVRLDAFAALHSASEERAEGQVIEMLPAETPARAQRPTFHGSLAGSGRLIRIAATAAVIVAVIVGIDFLRGIHNGPAPAFASVMERMERAETVAFRDREWYLGEWHTRKFGFSRSCSRVEGADMITISHRQLQDTTMEVAHDTTLVLYPALKRGAVIGYGVVPFRKTQLWKILSQPRTPEEKALSQRYKASMKSSIGKSSAEGIASWHKRDGFSLVRRERREGRNAAVYQSIGRNHITTWTTWADEETGLPFRVEIVSPPEDLHCLQLSDFLPPGSSPSTAAGWTALGPGEPRAIYDEFQWNTKLDTSYFSLTPPPGYTIVQVVDSATQEESKKLAMLNRHGLYFGGGLGSVPYEAGALAKGLSIWASLSGGALPDDLRYLGDSTRVKPLLVAKYNKGGVPGDELRAAIKDASQLEEAFDLAQSGPRKGSLHYLGKGVTSGDSTKIVCWGSLDSDERELYSSPYWIIYGDFRCAPSMTPPKTHAK